MRYSFFPGWFAVLLLIFTGCATRTTIITNIPEKEANQIIVLLASRNIDAQKLEVTSTGVGATTENMWNITVPSSQITEALSILNQAGFPHEKTTTLLDLFGAQGLVPSDLQDKIRYQEGLSEQLASTIRKMDGILDADVQITFPQEGETEKELTASVYVKHRGILDNPNSLTITKIKRLISSAIPSLKLENVSVVADRAVYADISLEPMTRALEDLQYVSIWGITVAKGSSFAFQMLFYTFIVVLFILICFIAWLLWKCFSVIQKNGGVSSLFRIGQYECGEVEETTVEE